MIETLICVYYFQVVLHLINIIKYKYYMFFFKFANSVTVLHRLICTSGPKAPHGHHVEDHGGHGGHGHDHPKDIHAVSDVM